MKSHQATGLLILFFASFFLIGSCSNSNSRGSADQEVAEEIHHGESDAFNSAYVCPMHCSGSGSTEPGTCPVCGMTYVALEDHVEDGHSH